MKRLFFLLVLIICSITANSQTDSTVVYNLRGVSKVFDILINRYVDQYSRKLDRDSCLDLFLEGRSNYYLKVLKYNANKYGGLEVVFNKLPRDERVHLTHQELFGLPDSFDNPPGVDYYFHDNKSNDPCYKYKSEIMIVNYYSKTYDRRISYSDFILKRFYNKKGPEFFNMARYFLNCYMESKNHKKVIDRDGYGKYGIATLAILNEIKLNKKWKYEMVVCNIVEFTK